MARKGCCMRKEDVALETVHYLTLQFWKISLKIVDEDLIYRVAKLLKRPINQN